MVCPSQLQSFRKCCWAVQRSFADKKNRTDRLTGQKHYNFRNSLRDVIKNEIHLRNVDFIFRIFFVPKLADNGFVISENKYLDMWTISLYLRWIPTRYTSQWVSEDRKLMFQSVFEEVKFCIVKIESIYSRTVYNFIPCPKIFLINTLHMYNVNTQMQWILKFFFFSFYIFWNEWYAVVQNKSINYV